VGAGVGGEPDHGHDRGEARLGDFAPAGVGCSDHGVRAQGDGGGDPFGGVCRVGGADQAHLHGDREGGRGRVVRGGGCRAVPRGSRAGCRAVDPGNRHPRCLVRFRFDACVHAGRSDELSRARWHQAQAAGRSRSGDVPGRVGPASRLVPFLADRSVRDARGRALRRRADAWLRARREGTEDVEVPRQRGRAAGRDENVGRGHPAAVGGVVGLFGRPAHRQGDREVDGGQLSQAQEYPSWSG
jgi:hypothetical protein